MGRSDSNISNNNNNRNNNISRNRRQNRMIHWTRWEQSDVREVPTNIMIGNVCKKYLGLLLAALAVFAFVGCDADATQVEQAATATNQMPNPVHEYDTYDALCDALGYQMVQLNMQDCTPTRYASIDSDEGKPLGEIFYTYDGHEVTLRMQPDVTGDISGIYGAQSLSEISGPNGSTVHIGKYNDLLIAWADVDETAYSLTADGVDQSAFETMLTDLSQSLTAA